MPPDELLCCRHLMATPLLQERYELQSEIASGGMATVYHGRVLGAVGFTRQVAIKRLHPQYAKDPEFVAMFMDEARIAARIRHRNVVPTLDVVMNEGELFLVMDHVTGLSLSHILKRVPRPPVAITAAIVTGMCQGLHAAHEATDETGQPLHIVHRDVSPHNVMLSEDGTARVVDFGIAKAVDGLHTTRDGTVKGKLPYMPIEQLEAAALDRRADVYSAAAVLWEMLAGRRLITAPTEASIITTILAHDFDPPSTETTNVSEALDAITMTGLQRDRSERFETCRALSVAIEEACEVASSRKVADWLEDEFGEELEARRAALIAQAQSQRTGTIVCASEGGTSPAGGSTGGLDTTVSDATSVVGGSAGNPGRSSAASLGDETRATAVSAVTASAIPRHRWGPWLPAAGLVALGGVAAYVFMGGETRVVESQVGATTSAAASTESQPATTTEAAAAPASATATQRASAQPSASIAVASPPVRPSAALTFPRPTTTVEPPPTPPSAAPPASAQPSCDPPFTVGNDNVKRYKPWCLK